MHYAPPGIRPESVHEIPVAEVERAINELDTLLRETKDEIAKLEHDSHVVRNVLVEHSRRIAAGPDDRQRAG